MLRFVSSSLITALISSAVFAQLDTVTIGNTMYEVQHPGTIGRMVARGDDGWTHFTWTGGDSAASYIYSNEVNPLGVQTYPGVGLPITVNESSSPTVDLTISGDPIYAGQVQEAGGLNTAVIVPSPTGFVVFPAPANNIIWPQMQVDRSNRIQIFSLLSGYGTGNVLPQRHLTGTLDAFSVTYPPAWTPASFTVTKAQAVATSTISNRTVYAWTYSRERLFPFPDCTYIEYDNDLYYLIDLDGLNPDFSNAFNLTAFRPPDPSFFPDTLLADRDTLRVYSDISLIFDQNDFLHIAFTTRSYYFYERTSRINASLIWHWSEMWPDQYRVIGSNAYFSNNNYINCGDRNLKAQRPSLGLDSETGNIYCLYQVFDTDTNHLSAGGYPSADLYASVSTDDGLNWSQGTNVTSTITPYHAPTGQCWSEMSPSLAKKIDDTLHFQYVLDRDAGCAASTEGAWTENPVIYHKIPVAMLPTSPLVPQILHLRIPAG